MTSENENRYDNYFHSLKQNEIKNQKEKLRTKYSTSNYTIFRQRSKLCIGRCLSCSICWNRRFI